MIKNKKLWFFLCFCLVLIVSFFIFNSEKFKEKIHPRRGPIIETIYGLGTVTPLSTYQVRSGVTLAISKIYVREGDVVKKNDPLALLDSYLSRSPIDGTVTHVSYMDGEIVVPQSNIVTVTNLQSLYLEVSLEQQSILRVKSGQSVVVSFESLRQEKYSGLVKSVFSREGQFIIRIDLEKWPEGVLPGMTADVAILVGTKKEALLIPVSSLFAGKVKRFRNGKLDNVDVKLGAIAEDWGEVMTGDLLETDEIVVGKK